MLSNPKNLLSIFCICKEVENKPPLSFHQVVGGNVAKLGNVSGFYDVNPSGNPKTFSGRTYFIFLTTSARLSERLVFSTFHKFIVPFLAEVYTRGALSKWCNEQVLTGFGRKGLMPGSPMVRGRWGPKWSFLCLTAGPCK